MSVKTQGSTISISDLASPEVLTAIGAVTGYSGPTGSRNVIDTTKLNSTGKEKNVGIPDFGQVSFDFNFSNVDSQLTAVWDAFISGIAQNFEITFPDSPNTVFGFTAFILNYAYTASLDDVVRGSATLEITGTITDNLP